MRARLSVCVPDRPVRDVRVTAPDGTRLRDVFAELVGPSAAVPRDGAVWSGCAPVALSARLGGAGLRDGDVLHLGHPGADGDAATRAPLQLAVVGGPDAGRVLALRDGETIVGRDPSCDLVLSDAEVSRRHVALAVSSTHVRVRDLGSTNGTRVEAGVEVVAERTVRVGDLVRIGESTLTVHAPHEVAAAVTYTADGALLINRPPRPAGPDLDREVEFPERRVAASKPRLQWLAALLPALGGIALAVAFHSLAYLAFALLSPLMLVGTAAGDRWHWRRGRRVDHSRYAASLARAERRRSELLAAETVVRRRTHPDPASVFRTVRIPDCRIWERRTADPDALTARAGLADQDARLMIRRGTVRRSAGKVTDVPLVIDLSQGPLGLVGPLGFARGIARWVVSQLVAAHAPADLSFHVLLTADNEASWTWTRWLPHVGAAVAATADAHAEVVATLQRVIDTRTAESTPSASSRWPGPWIILVLDRAGSLSDVPGLASLLASGHRVGITAICVDDRVSRLPGSCATVAAADGATGARLTVRQGQAVTQDVAADQVDDAWAERFARALSPLVDAGADAGAAVPHTCRLIEVLGLDEGDFHQSIVRRWRSADGRLSTAIGAASTGVVQVDLVRDGPHVLVAGTTGSGKSELLRSLVAGLAVSKSPDDLCFVLVDYKGGAAFAECGRLPHTVGVVTDLDAHLTRRALRSLDAELRRRERLFAAAGARDLDQYRGRSTTPGEHAALPRLVLIIDEFAALAEELPEFLTGLIDVAQRGRSLGVHLVLATQRPGGVVSPEIRANTALRLALRMTDPVESSDVIGSAAAATIDKAVPGRAFVRTGSTVTEVQTAHVCRPVPAARPISVEPLDRWGRPPDAAPAGGGADRTDLQLLTDAALEASRLVGAPRPRPPWLAPLPETLPLAQLDDLGPADVAAVGLIDLPDAQDQLPLDLGLDEPGAVLLVGGAGSGRTSALITATVAAARRQSAELLRVYAVDCANGSLRMLLDLPHCAAALGRQDFDVIDRLIAGLGDGTHPPQSSGRSGDTAADDGRTGPARTLGMLVLDGWEGFVAASEAYDGGRTVDAFLGVVRDATTLGLTVLVSGDRTSLVPRLAGLVGRRFVLRLSDRADYALAGIPTHRVPVRMPPGRAVRTEDQAEVQFAVLGRDGTPTEQRRAITEVASTYSGRSPVRAVDFRPLPNRVRLDELGPVDPQRPTLGVGGDRAVRIQLDLFAGPAVLLVAGPPRSGRTTTLRLIGAQMATARVRVTVVAPPRSPLASYASSAGWRWVAPDAPPDALEQPDAERWITLIDDADACLDRVVGDQLAALARRAVPGQILVVAARTDDLALTYRGLAAEVRRGRTGLLLQPAPGDGELLGVRLPRTRMPVRPGRGVLIGDLPRLTGATESGSLLPVQVATP